MIENNYKSEDGNKNEEKKIGNENNKCTDEKADILDTRHWWR